MTAILFRFKMNIIGDTMKNKGFSLVELLVTISIIGVISLIAFPLVNNLIFKNQVQRYETYRNVIEEASKKYMDDMGFLVSGCYEIKTDTKTGYQLLEEEGLITGFQDDCKETRVFVTNDEKGKRTKISVNLTCKKDGKYQEVLTPEYNTTNACNYNVLQYNDGFYAKRDDDVNSPKLNTKMIPIKYYTKTNKWIVADINNLKTDPTFSQDYSWYFYKESYFAHAVFVKEDSYAKYRKGKSFKTGAEVNEEDITSWWIWVPRFEYNKNAKDSQLHFLKNTKTQEKEGYTLHSAFKSSTKTENKELLGFWINRDILDLNEGKSNDQKLDIVDYFKTGIEFNKAYHSHVMRNSEYDAAYLLNTSLSGGDIHKLQKLNYNQLVGGNAYTSGTPILYYNYEVQGKFEVGDKATKTTVCSSPSLLDYNFNCNANYNICYYHSNTLQPLTCKDICLTSICKNKCKQSGELYVNNHIKVTMQGTAKTSPVASPTTPWVKYIEQVPAENIKSTFNGLSSNLSCSSKTTVVNDPFTIYVSTPWAFRNNDKYTDVIKEQYNISYDASSISNTLVEKGNLGDYGITNINNLKNEILTLEAKRNQDFIPQNLYTRFVLYY